MIARRSRHEPGRQASGAATHPVDYLIAGESVLVAELRKLLLGDLIGQPGRIVGRFRITEAAQEVDEPLPVVWHEPTIVPSTTVHNPQGTVSATGRAHHWSRTLSVATFGAQTATRVMSLT
jgi:hypothetical protein